MIKTLSVKGFRGFGEERKIEFALPDGEHKGSGLTIITGANNSGKTTIIESLKAFNGHQSPSFSEGRRNKKSDGKVRLVIKDDKNTVHKIESISNGSQTQRDSSESLGIYVVPSRREFPFEFGRIEWTKSNYIQNSQTLQHQRNSQMQGFEGRIFQIEKNKENFDLILRRILGDGFNWFVEQRDSGSHYVMKYVCDDVEHSSEGIGDGIWSVFIICAALFDAESSSTVVKSKFVCKFNFRYFLPTNFKQQLV